MGRRVGIALFWLLLCYRGRHELVLDHPVAVLAGRTRRARRPCRPSAARSEIDALDRELLRRRGRCACAASSARQLAPGSPRWDGRYMALDGGCGALEPARQDLRKLRSGIESLLQSYERGPGKAQQRIQRRARADEQRCGRCCGASPKSLPHALEGLIWMECSKWIKPSRHRRPDVRCAESRRAGQRALDEIGYINPTPVQLATYGLAIAGRDIIVQARTGTGKTAAFGIPLVDKLVRDEPVVQALVLAPTRELALQSAREIERIGKHCNLTRGRGLRRRADGPADRGARGRRADRLRHAGPRARPPAARHARPVAAHACSCSTRRTRCSRWASRASSTRSSS